MESALEQVAAEAMAQAVASREAENASVFYSPPKRPLETVSIARNRYSYADKILYRVYEKPGHFKLIEADSAHEAYAKSEISSPYKIQREVFFTQVAIAQEDLQPTDERIELDLTAIKSGNDLIRLKPDFIEAELARLHHPFEAMNLNDIARSKTEQAEQRPAADGEPAETLSQSIQADEAAVEQSPPEPSPAVLPEEEMDAINTPPSAPKQEVDPQMTPQEALPVAEPAPPAADAAALAEADGETAASAAPPEPARALTADEVNALLSSEGED